MNTLIHTGGGTFDPKEENIYFLALKANYWNVVKNPHILNAVNEIRHETSERSFTQSLDFPGRKVFLDSGIYHLATSYAKARGISMDQALSTPPEQIDGFTPLFDRYVHLVTTYGEKLWGYTEIDQGGRENKLKTRAKLEALGLRPIPVYHPLNDGWDYFDYLAERYDRICVGNVVNATHDIRKRLLATIWERKRKYPHLWIHLLGMTQNSWSNSLPINSGDSSSWMTPLRYPIFRAFCLGTIIGDMGEQYRYHLGSNPDDANGSEKSVQVCTYKSSMDMLTWRRYLSDLTELGIDPVVPVDPAGNHPPLSLRRNPLPSEPGASHKRKKPGEPRTSLKPRTPTPENAKGTSRQPLAFTPAPTPKKSKPGGLRKPLKASTSSKPSGGSRGRRKKHPYAN